MCCRISGSPISRKQQQAATLLPSALACRVRLRLPLEPVAAQRAASARTGSSAAAVIMPASIASQAEAPASAPAPAPAVSAAAVPFAGAAKQARLMMAPTALTLQGVQDWLPLGMPAISCTQLLAVRYSTANQCQLS